MKTLGLIVVLGVGVLAILFALVPLGVTTTVTLYPERGETTLGNLRIGEVTVRNDGVFTRAVSLPQLVACAGAQEVAIDAYLGAAGTVVRGSGQLPYVSVQPGETGTVYLVTRESGLYETISVYAERTGFSCLTATEPLAVSQKV